MGVVRFSRCLGTNRTEVHRIPVGSTHFTAVACGLHPTDASSVPRAPASSSVKSCATSYTRDGSEKSGKFQSHGHQLRVSSFGRTSNQAFQGCSGRSLCAGGGRGTAAGSAPWRAIAPGGAASEPGPVARRKQHGHGDTYGAVSSRKCWCGPGALQGPAGRPPPSLSTSPGWWGRGHREPGRTAHL